MPFSPQQWGYRACPKVAGISGASDAEVRLDERQVGISTAVGEDTVLGRAPPHASFPYPL